MPMDPMKMTMHIDEALLADVMELTGAASKTEAVELACALEHDLPVLTFDKHFRHIPGPMAVNNLP